MVQTQIHLPAILPHSEQKFIQWTLREILHGNESPDTLSHILRNEPMQVILCAPVHGDIILDPHTICHDLRISTMQERFVYFIPDGPNYILLIIGRPYIQKFQDWIHPILCPEDADIAHGFPEYAFLACSDPIVMSAELPAAYQQCLDLLELRFFIPKTTQILCPAQLPQKESGSTLTGMLLSEYVEKLLQLIQTFHRSRTARALQSLEQAICRGTDSPNAIRLFYCDLYLQIKERMRSLYPGYTIPFYSNSHIIQTIFTVETLSDITLFLTQRFDMIMSAIGASSRESVLEDILHYIRHNFNSNLTLENIAPLFGYNHSYLGKIFHKKVGMSFNEYIDRLRIDQAKELLLQDNAKIYAISELVGYRNVDYFHVKFRKYVNMSPAQFRKMYSQSSNSPDGENLEKGSLFRK